jgi:hypothetical protein
MKTYTALYAENVPHMGCVDFEAEDPADAIAKARKLNFDQLTTNPDWSNTVSRRIVEITDENENIVAEFIPLDPLPARFNR